MRAEAVSRACCRVVVIGCLLRAILMVWCEGREVRFFRFLPSE
jgi:hypothetical protein